VVGFGALSDRNSLAFVMFCGCGVLGGCLFMFVCGVSGYYNRDVGRIVVVVLFCFCLSLVFAEGRLCVWLVGWWVCVGVFLERRLGFFFFYFFFFRTFFNVVVFIFVG